ncbi:MAG: ABC-2 family transporter protein [Thermomicrobiales bacterium]|nr:ABC-2 family transporter protein [Thermomicrobiales bacterium]
MTSYHTYFRKSFKKNAAYRTTVWLQIVSSLIQVGIQVAVWTALIGNGAVDGIGRDQMITYVILNAAMYAFRLTGLYNDVDARLRSGDIAIDILRPVHYPLLVLAESLGRAAYHFVFMVVPIVIVSAAVFGFSAPASISAGIGFIFALLLAMLISYAIGYLIALLSFWFLTTFHFSWAIGGLTTLFSGAFLPLWFFPEPWATVAKMLPFQFLGFVPAATWMGQLTGTDLVVTFAVGILWCVTLLMCTRLLWNRATSQLVVQGG